MTAARKRIEEAQHDEATTQMLLEIRRHIVEETVSMDLAFDGRGNFIPTTPSFVVCLSYKTVDRR
jgi:hypothetical protein